MNHSLFKTIINSKHLKPNQIIFFFVSRIFTNGFMCVSLNLRIVFSSHLEYVVCSFTLFRVSYKKESCSNAQKHVNRISSSKFIRHCDHLKISNEILPHMSISLSLLVCGLEKSHSSVCVDFFSTSLRFIFASVKHVLASKKIYI